MSATTEAISAIVGHHAELQERVRAGVNSLLSAAREGTPTAESVGQLRTLLAHDVVPHARAEEDVLYAAARQAPLQPLVAGMILEHETLVGLTADLASAASPVDAAAAAAAIAAVFAGHVRRENELLLPALAADPDVDLPALLPLMGRRFAAYQAGSA